MWRMIIYAISGIGQLIILVLLIREMRNNRKMKKIPESLIDKLKVTDDKPKSLTLRGWNKHHKLIFYECPVCECPYTNVYFRNNHLKPSSTFTCDLCNAKLTVPDY